MCGIVGIVGSSPCISEIFLGLKRLEYRGYDSSGIAVIDKETVHIAKSRGKLSELESHLSSLPKSSAIGIGHTRWATHGRPSSENAHPHKAKGVVVVHNGILENYQDLKVELLEAGAEFSSETDSEVFAHLLVRELESVSDVYNAIVNLSAKLVGAYGLGFMASADPESLYVIKKGSPVVIARSEDGYCFASDVVALVDRSKEFLFLEDGEFARITKTSVDLWDFSGRQIKRDFVRLDWESSQAEKCGFMHFMLKEIHEQPAILSRKIKDIENVDGPSGLAPFLGIENINWQQVNNITITGCGTAFYAGVVGKYILEPILGLPVTVELASELRYSEPYVSDKTLLVVLSQSGETADTLACVKQAKSLGAQVLSICNSKFSSIVRESTADIKMKAGIEVGVASTKAFTTMLFDFYLLSFVAADQRGILKPGVWDIALACFRKLPILCSEILNKEQEIAVLGESFLKTNSCLYVGRGLSYPIALEGALKLKEISYIHAEGYAGGELKHGPIALVDKTMPIIAVVPKDKYREKMLSNIEEICAREGRVIGIGCKDDEDFKRLCTSYIPCPQIEDEVLQAVLSTIPLQLLSYSVAVFRGTDVDQPRNLAKSVTVE